MGLFQSREQKVIDASLGELNEFLRDDFNDWDRTLKLTISSKRASEFPVEKIEPVLRNLWVECYARAIVFSANAEAKYSELITRIPNFSKTLPEGTFNSLVSNQRKEMGYILGAVVREISGFKPEYAEILEKHLEEPELSVIKNEAKIAVKNLLK